MARTNKFIFIILAVISTGIFVSCQTSENRKAVVETVTVNAYRLQNLADSIESLIDTGFMAQYRIKPGKFQFQYLKPDNETGDFFSTSNEVESAVTPISKQLGITKLLKFYNDNFLSFEMAQSHTFKPLVLVLKKNEEEFEIRENSRLGKADSTASTAEFLNARGRDFIHKVNKRVWIFFPVNE